MVCEERKKRELIHLKRKFHSPRSEMDRCMSTHKGIVREHNIPPQNMPLWYIDYFKLVILNKQPTEAKL